jgi:UDP-2,3-diacylglucosamine pyrophosphatase LpxH
MYPTPVTFRQWGVDEGALGGAAHWARLSMETDEPGDSEPSDRGNAYRAVFISDIHLGTAGCQAEALLDFLRHHPSDTLYRVGDNLYEFTLRLNRHLNSLRARLGLPSWSLSQYPRGGRPELTPCAALLLRDEARGANSRGSLDGSPKFATKRIARKTTARKGSVQNRRLTHLLACVCRLAHDAPSRHASHRVLDSNAHVGSSEHLPEHKVKSALNYVTDFERAVAAEARQRGYDDVVCDHIHRAEMRTIDGTLYCNDGDWVESLTALVEQRDGTLALVHWQSSAGSVASAADPTSDNMEVA